MENRRLGVVGVGQMGEAIIRGALDAQWCRSEDIVASDVDNQRLKEIRRRYGVQDAPTHELPKRCSALLIAVKPQDVPDVLSQWSQGARINHLVISIAAGVRIGALVDALGQGARVIRIMPNNPCVIGMGCSAICASEGAGEEDLEFARTLFESLGSVVEVEEKWMDAVTAISGSGPAYLYLFFEAMVEAGASLGLPWDVSRKLVLQTIKGAMGMVESTGEHPAVLRERVSSPGGTTLAALSVMESRAFRSTIWEAIRSARDRSEQLGFMLEEALKRAL